MYEFQLPLPEIRAPSDRKQCSDDSQKMAVVRNDQTNSRVKKRKKMVEFSAAVVSVETC